MPYIKTYIPFKHTIHTIHLYILYIMYACMYSMCMYECKYGWYVCMEGMYVCMYILTDIH